MKDLKEFRTYRRRDVTRKSGFKVNGVTTGGECKIKHSLKYSFNKLLVLKYFEESLTLIELFNRGISMLGYGIYAFPNQDTNVKIELSYTINGCKKHTILAEKVLNVSTWNPIGGYEVLDFNDHIITDVELTVSFNCNNEGVISLACDDFKIVDYDYYVNNDVYEDFCKKTYLNIPYILYLENENDFLSLCSIYGADTEENGEIIVLKSCNRCGRYLPINIEDETSTLGFALHCKKRAPCKHHNFYNYKVMETDDQNYYKIDNGFVYAYYGHQLECKSCKKFFVNAPLNPLRNAQQFKEDGLRRRAFEVLVDNLLDKELIHHEFKKRTKKEFSQFIFDKFGGKCFKCGKELTLNSMNLDHTMPLAYLYRLDESATCLCDTHNSSKNDHFPCEFYSDDELVELSKITGLEMEILKSKSVNMKVVELLRENIVWFFDIFLAEPDYQKIRDGRLTADKIYSALVRVIPKEINLINDYYKIKKAYPKTITIK